METPSLALNEEHLRRLLDSTAEGLYELDLAGRCRFINRSALRLLGFESEAELLGQRMHELIHSHKADHSRIPAEACPLYLALEKGTSLHLPSEVFIRRDKTPLPVDCFSQPLYRGEELVGSVVTFFDISAQVEAKAKAEAELRRTNERHQLFLRAVDDVTYDWDMITQLLSWNERLTKVFGHNPPPGSTIDWWKASVHPDDLPRVTASLDGAMAGGASHWVDEYRFRRADGSYAVVLDRGLILRENGKPVRMFGVVFDQTERRELQARLANADRLASIGTLAAGVGHEINNPLAFIQSNVSFVLEKLRQSREGNALELGELTDALTEALEGAERVRVIVKDLKTFSRVDDESLAPVSLERALEAALSMASSELRHRAQVTRLFQPVPPVLGNEARLTQVFLNLLVNACQAIPEGAVSQHEISLSLYPEGSERVGFEIRDTGEGIDPLLLPRIFEPFVTSKPMGMGTGLGLSICHGIVTRLGGTIRAESVKGKGARFILSFPKCEPRPPPTQPKVAPPSSSSVLIIDDEMLVASSIARSLRRQHEVTIFTDGREALAWLDGGGRCDAIVCDLMMPEMTGMEVYRELSARHPALAPRVVFITGGVFSDAAKNFLEGAENICLEKPFGTAQLLEALGSVLRR